MRKRFGGGFTIVELLIVIVVIGILAAIVIVAYTGVQQRAQAAAVVSGIKSADKAFRLLAAEQGYDTWPLDTTLTGHANPTLDDLIANTDLKKYLQQVPQASGLTLGWGYDNDGDSRAPTACDTKWTGVNLTISGVPDAVLQQIDNTLDDGNTSCGRVRLADSSRIIYQLGFTQNM